MVEPQGLPTDPGFARRIEEAEAEAWLDLEPAPSSSRLLEEREVDGAIVLLDRSTDWPHSRIFNLGLQRPASARTIATIIDMARRAEVVSLDTDVSPVARPGNLARVLTAAGFRQAARNVVVARDTVGMPEPDGFFRIRLGQPADTDAIVQLMQRVMLDGPDWTVLLANQIGRPKWRFHLALEDRTVVALGAIHIHDDIAWLPPIWVLEEFRNRGTQAALIAHAVRDAATLGVEWVTASYPAAIPGRTRNFDRLGFSMVYLRTRFVWEASQT